MFNLANRNANGITESQIWIWDSSIDEHGRGTQEINKLTTSTNTNGTAQFLDPFLVSLTFLFSILHHHIFSHYFFIIHCYSKVLLGALIYAPSSARDALRLRLELCSKPCRESHGRVHGAPAPAWAPPTCTAARARAGAARARGGQQRLRTTTHAVSC